MDEWLQIHSNLVRHPKLAGFARELGIGRPQAMGHLLCLWLWALESASAGDLSGLAPAYIAECAQWQGKPDTLWLALTKCYPPSNSAWVDGNGCLHDWMDYAGGLLQAKEAKRQADRERQARRRERMAESVTRDKNVSHAHVTRESRSYSREEERIEEGGTRKPPSGGCASGPNPAPPPQVAQQPGRKIRDGSPTVRLFPREIQLKIDACTEELAVIDRRGKLVDGRMQHTLEDQRRKLELVANRQALKKRLTEVPT